MNGYKHTRPGLLFSITEHVLKGGGQSSREKKEENSFPTFKEGGEHWGSVFL